MLELQGEVKSAWSVSLLPGIMATPTTLVYGRLGAGNIGADVWDTEPGDEDKESQNMDLMVLGLGVKHAFSDAMTLSVEYKTMTADKTFKADGDEGEQTYKSDVESTGLEVGLQYHF